MRAAAAAEGLTLVPSDNAAGFKGVSAEGSHYFAYTQVNGKQQRCGTFSTALEAALAVARQMGSVPFACTPAEEEVAPARRFSCTSAQICMGLALALCAVADAVLGH